MSKKLFILSAFFALFASSSFTTMHFGKTPKYLAGDILFISNPGGSATNMQLLTKSGFSHIGLILSEKGKLVVYYVGEKVKKTGVAEFIALSKTGKYDHMRLRDSTMLRFTGVPRLVEEANKLVGFPYDKYMMWTDMEMYPSEFVWKVYKRALDLQLGATKAMSSFDLSSPVLQKNLKEKYGDNLPADQKIISPADMHDCDWLIKVN